MSEEVVTQPATIKVEIKEESQTSDETAHKRRKKKRKAERDVLEPEKRVKPNRPGCGEEKYDETEYYFENGLRKVYPYTYTFTSFCKRRWIGQPLFKVFSEEFRSNSRTEYEKFVKAGKVTVNGEHIDPDYILKDNDLIANRVHRHETAVLAAPLKILHQSEDLVVIDKPPSVPVHPGGRYRNNTVAFILVKEHGLRDLHVLHRLDHLTSGVLMFGKRTEKTKEIETQMREQNVSKEYLCRVKGNFPDGTVQCDQPLDVLSLEARFCIVTPNGKPALTVFQKLSYNGESSVVLCQPKTGRMHQIRVHLQYLGFPIVNDPIYNDTVFGPNKGKDGDYGKSKEQLLEDYLKTVAVNKLLESDSSKCDEKEPTKPAGTLASLRHYTDSKEYRELEQKYKFDPQKVVKDTECYDCTLGYKDPPQSDLIMYLHALKYTGEGWEFKTDVPVWAEEIWKEEEK